LGNSSNPTDGLRKVPSKIRPVKALKAQKTEPEDSGIPNRSNESQELSDSPITTISMKG